VKIPLPGAKLVKVWDADVQKAREFAATYQVPEVARNPAEMAAGIDGVLLADGRPLFVWAHCDSANWSRARWSVDSRCRSKEAYVNVLRNSVGLRLSLFAMVIAFLTTPFLAKAADLGTVPVGFGRNTTGGKTPCVVTTLEDNSGPGSLRTCAEKGGNWVTFRARGTIDVTQTVMIGSNTTIDGRGKAPVILRGSEQNPVIFRISSASNIIISDLFLTSRHDTPRCVQPKLGKETLGCGVPIVITGKTRNVWIHQSDFNDCGEKCIAIGNQDENGPDGITVSNCLFRNSFYAFLLTASPFRKDVPEMRVTMYGNMFYNNFRRTPRACQMTKLHAFNNLMKYWGPPNAKCAGADRGFAAASAGEAQLVLENNIFEARPGELSCKTGVEIDVFKPQEGFSRGMGKVRHFGNLLLNAAELRESEPEQVFNPGEFYSYTARTADAKLKAHIEKSAGVRGFGGRVF